MVTEKQRIRYGVRAAAKARDNYACQLCGFDANPDIVQTHHIFGRADFPDLQEDIGNLVTLCPNCHVVTEKSPQRALPVLLGLIVYTGG